MLNNKEFIEFVKTASNGVCTPYYQGILAREFINQGLIPKDSVIVTGNSGDVLEGAHFNPKFEEGESYTKDEIIDEIISAHYMLFGKNFSKKKIFRKYVSIIIDSIEQKNIYTYKECNDILEFFNWRERQSKYVINDVRCYDEFLSNEWRLPLWDSEFMNFWLKVPIELQKNRNLYYEYVKEEKFLTANDPTIYLKAMNFMKAKAMTIVELLYPIRKLVNFCFGESPFYAVNIIDYLRILRITKGYMTNTITSHIYFELTRIYNEQTISVEEIVSINN